MKTTIDLPDALVKAARQRALHEGRTFRDLVAAYIRQGLNERGDREAAAVGPASAVVITESGFPLFRQQVGSPTLRAELDELLALERDSLQDDDLHRAGIRI